MTTPTIDLIHRHRSVRSYRAEPVSRETVRSIVAAAQRSSTSSNLQMFSAVVVTDDAKREHLAELCGRQEQIRQAPVFIAWCADLSRLDRVCQMQGREQVTEYVENFLVAAVDTAIAMQTAALAAESLGLGICFIGAIRNQPQAIIELLRLPRLVFPVAGMTLGWPAVTPRQRPRLALDAVLHWEEYDTAGEEELLREYDRAMQATGIYAGRQVRTAEATTGAATDYGWLEHSARRAAKALRTDLRDVLREQGFDLA